MILELALLTAGALAYRAAAGQPEPHDVRVRQVVRTCLAGHPYDKYGRCRECERRRLNERWLAEQKISPRDVMIWRARKMVDDGVMSLADAASWLEGEIDVLRRLQKSST